MKHFLSKFSIAGAFVATMMSVPALAQAQTTIYERGGDGTAWSDADLTEWTAPGDNTFSVTDAGLTISANKSNTTSTKDIKVTENSSVTVSAVWAAGNATGTSNTYSVFGVGDLKFLWYGSGSGLFVQAGSDEAVSLGLSGRNYRNKTWTIDATINQATGEIAYKISSGNTSKEGTLTHPNGSYSLLTLGLGGKRPKWDNTTSLTSIKISEEKQAVTTANYTVQYLCDGKSIKANTTYEGVVGGSVTLGQSDMATITAEDGTRYIYESNDADGKVISDDGSTLVTVTYHKAAKATLNVNYVVNGETTTLTTALEEADDASKDWTYVYPLYKQGTDGKYYKVDNAEAFGEKVTFTDGETISKSVTYSSADDQVVFFGEAEGDQAGTDLTCSNGATGVVAAQNYTNRGYQLGTYQAGKYDVIVNITANAGRNIVVRDASSTDQETNALASTDGKSTGEQTLEFTLTEEKTLLVNGHNAGVKSNQSADFDYVIVKLIEAAQPEVKTATVTINETSKVASYSNDAVVTVPEDVKVYIVTKVSADGAKLAQVDTKVIPAGQGVILYSETPGDKTLTLEGEADESLFSANLLKATGSQTVTSDGAMYAVYMGQQIFARVMEGVVIPANKAYLATAASTPSKLTMNFGSTTGIQGVSAEENVDNAPVYNIAGQRVGKNYKGIVIVNGKKMIIK